MAISLEKRSEKVKIQLKKHNVREKVVLRVGACLDKSGSAQPFYMIDRKRGQTISDMDHLMSRLLAVADNFDDNGEIDSWIFSNNFHQLESANASNYGNYVEKVIMGGKYANWWEGTSYAPAMRGITDFYFPSVTAKAKGFFGSMFRKNTEVSDASSDIPALVFFVTDGANTDQRDAEQAIMDSQDKNIYWMMVGVGSSIQFKFIEDMADKYPNVGFVNFDNLDIDDDDMYNAILDGELTEWIKSRK